MFWSDLFPVGDKVFFIADDGIHGKEIWVSDGKAGAAHTHMVADINPDGDGINDFNQKIVDVGGSAYFSAYDHTLWKSDGTTAVQVPDAGYASYLTPIGNQLLFLDGDDGTLRLTDGATTTTLSPDSFWNAYQFTNVDGKEYFATPSALYALDLRANSVSLVKDFGVSAWPMYLTAVGDKLFFAADDGVHGTELWVSEAGKTHLVKDINQVSTPSDAFSYSQAATAYAQPFSVFDGGVLFIAYDDQIDSNHYHLYWSDGATTRKLVSLEAPSNGALINAFVDADAVYFEASDGPTTDVWRTDGTRAGTYKVTSNFVGDGYDGVFPIFPGPANHAPSITSNGGGASASVSLAENTKAVTTVAASDPDAGAVLTYSISGGADAALFKIDAHTGTLSFVKAPDFENPTDSGANNVYTVKVQVSDGSLADGQSITVRVTNVAGVTITGDGADNVVDGTHSIGTEPLPTSEEDLVKGNGGSDALSALGGDDNLYGRAGNDTLTGGPGSDRFHFDTAPDAVTNVDHIVDFAHGTDTIVLHQSAFSQIGAAGALDGHAFYVASFATGQQPQAHDLTDRIIYNRADGTLYYDADGNKAGGLAPVEFAVLNTHPTSLGAADFAVVA